MLISLSLKTLSQEEPAKARRACKHMDAPDAEKFNQTAKEPRQQSRDIATVIT